MSKRFLKYETEDVDKKPLPVDEHGNLKPVNPDWNEEDETSPAFIHNKPENLGGGVTLFSIYEPPCSASSSSNLVKFNSDVVLKGLTSSYMFGTEGGEPTTIEEMVDAFNNGVVRIQSISSGGLNGFGTMTGYRYDSDRFVLNVTYATYGQGIKNGCYYFKSQTTTTSTSTTTSTTTSTSTSTNP